MRWLAVRMVRSMMVVIINHIGCRRPCSHVWVAMHVLHVPDTNANMNNNKHNCTRIKLLVNGCAGESFCMLQSFVLPLDCPKRPSVLLESIPTRGELIDWLFVNVFWRGGEFFFQSILCGWSQQLVVGFVLGQSLTRFSVCSICWRGDCHAFTFRIHDQPTTNHGSRG